MTRTSKAFASLSAIAIIGWMAACSSSTKDAEEPKQPQSESDAALDDEPSTLDKANDSVDRAHKNFKKNIKPVVGPIDDGVKKGG